MSALASDLCEQGFDGPISFDLLGELLALTAGHAPVSFAAAARPSPSSSASRWIGRNFWWLALMFVALCGMVTLFALSMTKDAQDEREALRRAKIYEKARLQSLQEEALRIQAMKDPVDSGVRAEGVEFKGHSSSMRVLSRRIDAGAVRTAAPMPWKSAGST